MRKIFIAVLLLSLTACVSNRQPQEFTTVYARRFIPQHFVALDYKVYKTETGQERLRCVGAVRGQDDSGRLGLVWAEYAQDRRGDWYRKGNKDEPFAFAKDLDEAKELAAKHLAMLR